MSHGDNLFITNFPYKILNNVKKFFSYEKFEYTTLNLLIRFNVSSVDNMELDMMVHIGSSR